jgi:capsular polysaccharide biosynthesis protein
MDNKTKAQMFFNAELIIGTYGAGLSNIFLTGPKCCVLELSSEDSIRTHFMLLAKASGSNFDYLLGSHMDSDENFTVDPEPLEQKILSALSNG